MVEGGGSGEEGGEGEVGGIQYKITLRCSSFSSSDNTCCSSDGGVGRRENICNTTWFVFINEVNEVINEVISF